MPDLEPFAMYFLAAGAALLFTGLMWMLIVAFKTGFIKKAFLPVLVILLGAVVALFVPVMTKVFPKPIDTRVKVEEKTNAAGETVLELTGTGADTAELKAKLAEHKKYTTIQMANKGFTDDDLKVLDGMDQLTFIDLNDNPVSDATLERLVKLPKLTKLYAARTKISGETVKKLVFDNPECKLTEIDFRGLTPLVPSAAQREWKNADKSRKAN
jgi:hypothetical protein